MGLNQNIYIQKCSDPSETLAGHPNLLKYDFRNLEQSYNNSSRAADQTQARSRALVYLEEQYERIYTFFI